MLRLSKICVYTIINNGGRKALVDKQEYPMELENVRDTAKQPCKVKNSASNLQSLPLVQISRFQYLHEWLKIELLWQLQRL
jgi:hypothetical protein